MFRSYPILLLTVPLAGGIYLSDTFFHSPNVLSLHLGILTVLTLVLLMSAIFRSYRYRWVFGLVLFLWMMTFGSVLVQYENSVLSPTWNPNRQIYHGVVLEPTRERAKTYCCRMKVDRREVLVYIMKDSLSSRISPFDSLIFRTQLSVPEANYSRSLSGVGIVFRGQWVNCGKARSSIRQSAMKCRTNLLHIIQEWGMPEEQGLINALAVGNKAELNADQRTHFSQAGVGHVLALSGLHVGIIWGVLVFLLSPFRKSLAGRVISWVVMTVVLWAYAFVTGLAASVVRAVAMCLLIELGRIRHSRISTINILSAVAGGMLIYHPYYLYDVGFQLSFLAVLSICICYRPLCDMISLSNPFLSYLWKLLCVSFSAQIGTAPLVAFYFGSFPVYFLLGNLLITPLIPLILYLIILSFSTAVLPPVHTCMLWLLKQTAHFVTYLTDQISMFPYSVIRFTSVSSLSVVWTYLFLASIIFTFSSRKRQSKIVTLVVIWLGTVLCLSDVYRC